MPTPRPMIIGHHLIWTLYGHWLANDLRGCGSIELYDEKFAPLGPIHHGRFAAGLTMWNSILRKRAFRRSGMISYNRTTIGRFRRSWR